MCNLLKPAVDELVFRQTHGSDRICRIESAAAGGYHPATQAIASDLLDLVPAVAAITVVLAAVYFVAGLI